MAVGVEPRVTRLVEARPFMIILNRLEETLAYCPKVWGVEDMCACDGLGSSGSVGNASKVRREWNVVHLVLYLEQAVANWACTARRRGGLRRQRDKLLFFGGEAAIVGDQTVGSSSATSDRWHRCCRTPARSRCLLPLTYSLSFYFSWTRPLLRTSAVLVLLCLVA